MPRATADTKVTERFDLKTLPKTEEDEGGFVVLRRMSYGEMLKRQEIASQIEAKGQNRRDSKLLIEMMQSAVAEYEYRSCIVDHNLEDENGTALDFRAPGTVARLDPRVGGEISQLIDDMNQPPDLEDLGQGSAQS